MPTRSTSVSDATEEAIDALEFTSSYAPDDSGNMGLVSEEFLPVVQFSKADMEQFVGDLPTNIVGDENYVFNATYFNQRLKEVRADPEILQRAHVWVIAAKRDLLDPSLRAKHDLEAKHYIPCGPSRRQSQRTCS